MRRFADLHFLRQFADLHFPKSAPM